MSNLFVARDVHAQRPGSELNEILHALHSARGHVDLKAISEELPRDRLAHP